MLARINVKMAAFKASEREARIMCSLTRVESAYKDGFAAKRPVRSSSIITSSMNDVLARQLPAWGFSLIFLQGNPTLARDHSPTCSDKRKLLRGVDRGEELPPYAGPPD